MKPARKTGTPRARPTPGMARTNPTAPATASGGGSVLPYAVALLGVTAVGGGLYYYFVVRGNDKKKSSTSPSDTTDSPELPVPPSADTDSPPASAATTLPLPPTPPKASDSPKDTGVVDTRKEVFQQEARKYTKLGLKVFVVSRSDGDIGVAKANVELGKVTTVSPDYFTPYGKTVLGFDAGKFELPKDTLTLDFSPRDVSGTYFLGMKINSAYPKLVLPMRSGVLAVVKQADTTGVSITDSAIDSALPPDKGALVRVATKNYEPDFSYEIRLVSAS